MLARTLLAVISIIKQLVAVVLVTHASPCSSSREAYSGCPITRYVGQTTTRYDQPIIQVQIAENS